MQAYRLVVALGFLVGVGLSGCDSVNDPASTQQVTSEGAASSAVTGGANYDFKALDVPAEWGAFTSAYGFNNAGVITGNYGSVDGTIHGFLFHQGAFTDDTIAGAAGFFLGALGDINEAGVAVDYYTDADGGGHATLREPDGTHTILPDALPGALDTDATGINDFETIVGTVIDAAGATHGYIRRLDEYETYDYPGALRTRLGGVNNQGEIAGFYTDTARHAHGFILKGIVTEPIEFPGAVSTRATALNNRGMVVGFYNNADGVFHAFLYQKGEFSTIDFPGSSDSGAFGINDAGTIVGTYDGFSRGFVATKSAKHEVSKE